MTIKEIETLSGLPRANIRYYESEGLITPKRAENGYREYSQADAEVLLRVKLLRALPWYLVLQAAGVDPKARLTSIWLSILGMVTMPVLEPLLLPTRRLPPPRQLLDEPLQELHTQAAGYQIDYSLTTTGFTGLAEDGSLELPRNTTGSYTLSFDMRKLDG